jgi:hypothetical protein
MTYRHIIFAKEGVLMTAFKGKKRLAPIVTVFLAVLILGGCTAIKYSYDMKTSFLQPKSYTWRPSLATYGRDPLLETNVQVLADQLLAQKGFTRMFEKSDLMISMSYEFDSGMYRDSYQLRMLTLNIYQFENKELVWRGAAFGTINTDAASGDLKKAVQGILSNFPPK